ncbi:MAG: hypothetical protein BKP49_10990 [Treponema sp. CETP13]|nr:MAG: hypothetical protein BKP49_10990 [Treponema sp. CETP13]
MAQITIEKRKDFEEKSKVYRDGITEINKLEKETILQINRDPTNSGYKKMALIEKLIYSATLSIAINALSLEVLDTKNNEALNDARKILYKTVIYLEEIVTNLVDAPFSDYAQKLEAISNVSLEKRYLLVKKLGLAIRLVTDAFGENSKWKWSFIELEARFSTVSKNLVNMKELIQAYNDPRNPEYQISVQFIRLIMRLLDKSSNGYRDKYELSTHRLDDMRLAIQYVISLRRIQILLGQTDEAENLKKKVSVWKAKMEADQKSGVSQ